MRARNEATSGRFLVMWVASTLLLLSLRSSRRLTLLESESLWDFILEVWDLISALRRSSTRYKSLWVAHSEKSMESFI